MAAISVSRALLFDPCPITTAKSPTSGAAATGKLEFIALRGHFSGFAGVAAYRTEDVTLERGRADVRPGIAATTELFSVLDVKPLLGRGFIDGEDALSRAHRGAELRALARPRRESADRRIAAKLDGVSRTVLASCRKTLPYPTIGVDLRDAGSKANYGI
jgi:hypothetical protein